MSIGVLARIVSVAVMAVAVMAAPGGPTASAAPAPQSCPVGDHTAHVHGDLVVKPGEQCRFSGTVDGSITVGANGLVAVGGGDVHGSIILAKGTTVSLASVTVDGSVLLHGATIVYALVGTIEGSVVGSLDVSTGYDTGPGVELDGVHIVGRVAVSARASVPHDSVFTGPGTRVDGGMAITGLETILLDTWVGHRLSIDAVSPDPAYSQGAIDVCGGTVVGNLVVTRGSAAATTDIGVGGMCSDYHTGPLDVRGSLIVKGNQASVLVGGHIGGDVVCRDNVHHPRGDPSGRWPLTIDGNRLGQCAHLPAP